MTTIRSGALLATLMLGAALTGRAAAQDAPVDTAPAETPIPSVETPIAAAPVAVLTPGSEPRPEPLVLIRPGETRPVEAIPTSQLFISPMGEPFRAGLAETYPVEAWLTRIDGDGDGAVSREEFIIDARAFFTRLDTSGDGVIDGFEDSGYETKVAPEVSTAGLAAGGDPGRKRKRSAPTGAARFGLLPEPQPVRSADTNLDFKVSAAEWDAAAMVRFSRLDADHNGKIGKAEIPQTYEQKKVLKLREAAAKDRPAPPPKS